jgi:hypothetical protein
MKSNDKPNQIELRDLAVQPDAAAQVKAGYWSWWNRKTTTTTTPTLTIAVQGESKDAVHHGEIDLE